MPVEKPAGFPEDVLLERVNNMVKKVVERRAKYALRPSDYPPAPQVFRCIFIQDHNQSFVLLNDTAHGFAKFNPNDNKVVKVRVGKEVVKQEVSKFNLEAGLNKALHRAVNKLLDPELYPVYPK